MGKQVFVEEQENVPYFENVDFDEITRRILHDIGSKEMQRLFSYDEEECEPDFLGFVDVYDDLKDKIPKDFTIIDLGCYQGFQGVLFKDHASYIGIDISIPNEWRLRQENAEYFHCSIQEFIKNILPEMELNMNKTFAVCSYVPDKEARKMVQETFPYHRVYYIGLPLHENIPQVQKQPEKKPQDLEMM